MNTLNPILTIMVSSGCPAIIPDVFAITDATKELKSDLCVRLSSNLDVNDVFA